MRFTFLASRVLVLSIASFWLVSCSDDGGVPEDFAFDCSLCQNGVPVGPSADEASCSAWGDEFECASAVLINEGLCDDDLVATCQVDDCPLEPVGCEL